MRALVAYSASSTFVQTTLDYLLSFKKYSGFDVEYMHVTRNSNIEFDFDAYDVVFHNYCARLCFEGYVGEQYRKQLRAFGGVKVLAVQDEYDNTDVLKAAIRDLGFHIVLTCVPQDALEYVYPRAEFPGVTFITVFTGYVSDDFASSQPAPPPLAARPIVVGYRGRDIGGKYGRLGFDKFEIGRRMKAICATRGVPHDIAMDEASRIYGMAWFGFLGRCRSMLGSESGSNVFDFDGSIAAAFRRMTAANRGVQPSYEQFLPVVAQRDSEISMGQISPRVFECALMRTPMVLFRGHYSGAIEPDAHYIPLDKDFSNVDEVLARLGDLPALEAMATRAYDHLVGSGRYSYRVFFGMVGEAIRARIVPRPDRPAAPAPAREGSFLLREARAIEWPSVHPDTLESAQLRDDLAEFAGVAAEIPRLEALFASHSDACMAQIAQLVGVAHARRQGLVDIFGPLRQSDLLRPPVEAPGEVRAFIDAAAREDAQGAAGVDQALRLLRENEGKVVAPTAYQPLREGLRQLIDRYRLLSQRFEDFNRIYAAEIAALQAGLEKVSREGLDLALLNLSRGRHPSAMARFIYRSLYGRIRAAVGKRIRSVGQ